MIPLTMEIQEKTLNIERRGTFRKHFSTRYLYLFLAMMCDPLQACKGDFGRETRLRKYIRPSDLNFLVNDKHPDQRS